MLSKYRFTFILKRISALQKLLNLTVFPFFYSVRMLSGIGSKDGSSTAIISLQKLGDTVFTIPAIKEIQKIDSNEITIVYFPESIPIYSIDLSSVNYCKIEHGDAQILKGIADETYDFVYSSHTIEHLPDPSEAIKNWFRVLKHGGYLIIYLPHRDLYEKKKELLSRFNSNHIHYFLIDQDDEPNTIGIIPFIKRSLTGVEIIYAKECNEGHTITDPLKHSDGEYSIEVVVKKK